MNQTIVDLYSEYKTELEELIYVAESSPQQFKDLGVAESFSREFDKLVALTNLYGRLLGSIQRKPSFNRNDYRRN